jgi:hypothetical protein
MELRKLTRKRLMDLLTEPQKAKWKELAGRPFSGEIPFEEPEVEKMK